MIPDIFMAFGLTFTKDGSLPVWRATAQGVAVFLYMMSETAWEAGVIQTVNGVESFQTFVTADSATGIATTLSSANAAQISMWVAGALGT